MARAAASLNPRHPGIRLAIGHRRSHRRLPVPSATGHTNLRIKGRTGRADQTTKVKGMFVRPEQVAEVGKRHPEPGRLRLVVSRDGEADVMTLRAEATSASPALAEAVGATLRAVTKLDGRVELVANGSLPNDGKVIPDERA